MIDRLAGGILVVSAAVAALFLGRVPLLLFMIGAGVVGAGDLFRRARAAGVRPAVGLGLVSIAGLYVFAHARGERSLTFFPAILAGFFLAAFVVILLRRDRAGATRGVSATIGAVLLVGFLGAYVLVMRADPLGGFRIVAGFALMVVANQLAAELAGRAGAGAAVRIAAGAAAAGLAALVAAAALAPPYTVARALILAAVVSVSAPAGAYAARMLQRVPEHPVPEGGLLPHVHPMLVTAPLFFYAFRALAR